MKVHNIVMAFLDEFPRSEWDRYIFGSDASIQEISDCASGLSVLAAELSEYAGFRGGYGFGDHGHEEALAEAKKARKRMRKALGYSYP